MEKKKKKTGWLNIEKTAFSSVQKTVFPPQTSFIIETVFFLNRFYVLIKVFPLRPFSLIVSLFPFKAFLKIKLSLRSIRPWSIPFKTTLLLGYPKFQCPLFAWSRWTGKHIPCLPKLLENKALAMFLQRYLQFFQGSIYCLTSRV